MTLDRNLPEYSRALASLSAFSRAGGIKLRRYQVEAGNAVVDSVKHGLGLTFIVIFPRQSGKDELLAQLKAYLMASCAWADAGIVEVNPTYKPQTINAALRLETRLTMNFVTQPLWGKRSDFMRTVGMCRTSFLSGDGRASVVGATASLLLIVNEAQDIAPAVYDKKFEPMRASTNATAVFCGTVWTSSSLLARETHLARLLEVGPGVLVDCLVVQHRAGFALTGGVADERRVIPDNEHCLVAEILKLPELAQDNAVAEVQVRRGRVAAEFDAEGTVLLELFLQFVAGDEGFDALFKQGELFFDRSHRYAFKCRPPTRDVGVARLGSLAEQPITACPACLPRPVRTRAPGPQ